MGPGESGGRPEVDVIQGFGINAVLVDQQGRVPVGVLLEHLELTAVVVLSSFGERLKESVLIGGHG